jgi:NADPH:quinone reductase-like Zn-dependent oxidoreductase
MATTMKALVSAEGKKAEVQADVPIPQPGEGEIIVKVHSVAQNPTDWKAVSAVPAGRTVGCDFAGEVYDNNRSHWKNGQRVAGFVQGTAVDPPRGAFAEYLAIEASLVFPIPDGVSNQDASVIPLPIATAIQAMFQRLNMPEPSKPAKSTFPFLVNGGTSSVGKYAIQLGKLSGAYVIATGSKKNHELLLSLGADAVVDYNDADWPEQVRQKSHDGLEHALDCIAENGTPENIAKALSSLSCPSATTSSPRSRTSTRRPRSRARSSTPSSSALCPTKPSTTAAERLPRTRRCGRSTCK